MLLLDLPLPTAADGVRGLGLRGGFGTADRAVLSSLTTESATASLLQQCPIKGYDLVSLFFFR